MLAVTRGSYCWVIQTTTRPTTKNVTHSARFRRNTSTISPPHRPSSHPLLPDPCPLFAQRSRRDIPDPWSGSSRAQVLRNQRPVAHQVGHAPGLDRLAIVQDIVAVGQ